MSARTTRITLGATGIVLGLFAVLAAVPLGFMTMLMGAFMCDAPGSSLTLCAAVAYGPPGVLVVVGLVATAGSIVLLVRGLRMPREP